MGFMDTLKGLFKGKETQVKEGIDTASDAAQKVVPDQHDDKVEAVAEKAKDVVDDLTDSEGSSPEHAAGDLQPGTDMTNGRGRCGRAPSSCELTQQEAVEDDLGAPVQRQGRRIVGQREQILLADGT